MASNLRVDTILPSTGTNVAIGTASGSVTFLGDTDITTSGSVSIGGTLTYEDVTNVDSIGVITARDGIRCTGIVTATAFHGDGSSLTGVGASFGNSSVNSTGIATFSAFVPTAQGSLSHRNIIINGAMMVAQRSTSSTTNGYAALDRFRNVYSNTDANVTQSQVDVASGTTPYTLGFRKALKITNGNQTSGDNGDTNIQIWQRIESQNIANSGWNYLSASSFVTLQFWVKSSVAQNFNCYLLNEDTTQNTFPFETGSLSANTWTKVTKKIPGNSNLTFNNDTGAGLRVAICPFNGTNRTSNSLSNDAWVTFANNNFTRVNTTTWLTTNAATFEITGVQLEVGSVATPFEHRSLSEEELRCQRYFWKFSDGSIYGSAYGSSSGFCQYSLPTKMRLNPGTLSYTAIRTSTGFYDYSSDQIMMVQMSATNPYITYAQLDAEL